MDKAEFWATKNLRARFETVTFSHASFSAPIRLVKDVFEDVTLGGNVYTAAPMDIKPPEQKSDTQPKLTISFPRPVVGRQFKQPKEGLGNDNSPVAHMWRTMMFPDNPL